MTATALGVLWGLLAGRWLWPWTAPPRRPGPDAGPRRPDAGRSAPLAGTGHPRPGSNLGGRHIAALAVAGLVGLAVHPAVAPLPVGAWWVHGQLSCRRAVRHHEAQVVDQLPDLVDLLRLTTAAGLPIGAAVQAIDRRPGGPVGAGLAEAAGRLRRGATTGQALAVLAEAWGPLARGLVDALTDHDRYGTPLAPALDRLAVETRLRRRRLAEEAARRLPIVLLFPLVLTTLPAFAVLTVVPLLVGSFASLQV